MKKLLFTLITGVVLLAITLAITSSDVKAQDYKNAIGGRFGTFNGLSFKTGLNKSAMLELIGNFRSNSGFNYLQLTALYEKYNAISGAPGLNWFYGAGGNIGTYKVKGFDNSEIYLGLNGVLGLDYKFKGAPINLSVDWIPTFQLTPNTDFYSGDVGLGIRYTF